MKISIEVVPHKDQRYETIGDWRFAKNGDLTITVSELPDPRYVTLVAMHEIHEALLCRERGIKSEDVDAFDIKFEEMRKEQPKLIGDLEPGDMKSAPYFREHQHATKVERLLARQLGVKWSEYEQALNQLPLL